MRTRNYITENTGLEHEALESSDERRERVAIANSLGYCLEWYNHRVFPYMVIWYSGGMHLRSPRLG